MTNPEEAMGEIEAKVAGIIREHHRTHVRYPTITNQPRRTFHQGDKEAARAIVAALSQSSGNDVVEECAKVAERTELFSGDRLINSDPRVTVAAAIRTLKTPS